MYISPHGDPFNTFIIYGSPLPYGTSNYIGDGWSFDYSCNTSCRTYYSIPIFKNYEDYSLTSVMFKVHQYNCYGNDEPHTFPIWHDGDPHYLMLAHVQYEVPYHGSSYDPGFVQNIGVISSDNVIGWRELDVTDAYNATLGSSRSYFQLMLYFEILSDWDNMSDNILLVNPNSPSLPPSLVVTYMKDVSADDNVNVPKVNRLTVYPNPVTINAIIKSDEGFPIDGIEMYNLRGQRITTVNYLKQSPIEWELELGSKLPAGVYLIRCRVMDGNKQKIITQKILIH
ncbi:MAG: T9SS type A sorting domain-containing protein, partial [Candidatus Cloacimonetes bacterium]|nr:T9SS type A sorting domain-containing protein [Candidatus Cloacimonadota bacterium]